MLFFLKGGEGGGDALFPVGETVMSCRTFAVLGRKGPDCCTKTEVAKRRFIMK